MPDYLMHQQRAVAVPAFRTVAIIDGDIQGAPNHAPVRALYALFEDHFGEAANVTSYNFPGYTGKIRRLNESMIRDARAWLDQRDTTPYGKGLRRYGYALPDFPEPALPFFEVEQRSNCFFLEIAIPTDTPDLATFAEQISDQLMRMPVIAGVMGLGRFLPPYLSSLEFLLGGEVTRHRAGIDIRASMADTALRSDGLYRWQEGDRPGIPDIGWRTFIGREYCPRIEATLPALADAPGVTQVRSDDVLALTAGPKPIWGTPDEQAGLAPYRAIARALAPVCYPRGAAEAFFFGGGAFDSETKAAAYLARFD